MSVHNEICTNLSEELPCQREGTNSEDLQKICAVCSMHSMRIHDLLDLRLKHTVLGVLSSSARNFWRKKFSREQIFASWRLITKIAKISCYTVYLLKVSHYQSRGCILCSLYNYCLNMCSAVDNYCMHDCANSRYQALFLPANLEPGYKAKSPS